MTSSPVPILRRLWLYMLVALVLAYLVAPIFIVVPVSFSASKYQEFPPRGYSLKWYVGYLGSADWLASTRTSLTAAVLTTLVATPAGVAAAYAINAFGTRLARLVLFLALLPAVVPAMLIAIGIFYVYIQVSLVNTMLGIVLAHTLLALPFVVITVLSGLRSFDLRQEMVARSLGAPRFGAFARVTLPQISASVVSGALFAFIISLDEVVVGLFVAGGDNMVLTRRMFVALRDALDPTIAAISTFFILVSVVVLGIVVLTRGRRVD
jgi:putative spermidine/putrescine transport system permease protein